MATRDCVTHGVLQSGCHFSIGEAAVLEGRRPGIRCVGSSRLNVRVTSSAARATSQHEAGVSTATKEVGYEFWEHAVERGSTLRQHLHAHARPGAARAATKVV
jgi:hypothetical protein